MVELVQKMDTQVCEEYRKVKLSTFCSTCGQIAVLTLNVPRDVNDVDDPTFRCRECCRPGTLKKLNKLKPVKPLVAQAILAGRKQTLPLPVSHTAARVLAGTRL